MDSTLGISIITSFSFCPDLPRSFLWFLLNVLEGSSAMAFEEILNGFDDLQFYDIADEFIDNPSEGDFLNEPIFDLVFESSSNEKFYNLVRLLREQSCEAQSLWTTLKRNNIEYKRLQAWLYYHLFDGLKQTSDFNERQRAIYAAQLVFILLKEQGGDSFLFFHEMFYEKCLRVMKMASTANHIQVQKRQNKKQQGHARMAHSHAHDEVDEVEEVEISASEAVKLIGNLTDALKDFCFFAQNFSFQGKKVLLELTAEGLADVIKEFGEVTFSSLTPDVEDMSLPDQIVYKAFMIMIDKNPSEVASRVFEPLMTIFTMKHAASCGTSSIPRAYLQRADGVQLFVKSVYKKLGKSVENEVFVFLKNVVAKSPEKNDYKHQMTCRVIPFLKKFPAKTYAQFVVFLEQLAYYPKVSHRVSALAVIGELLLHQTQFSYEDGEVPADLVPCLSPAYLLQIVFENFTDPSPTMRSKALSALAEVFKRQVLTTDAFTTLVQGLSLTASTKGSSRPSAVSETATSAAMEAVSLTTTEVGMSADTEAGMSADTEAGMLTATEAGMLTATEAGTLPAREDGTLPARKAGTTAATEAGTTAGTLPAMEAGTTAASKAGTTAATEIGTPATTSRQSRRTLFGSFTSSSLLPLITSRCSEGKVGVRRTAVQLLEASLCKGYIPVTEEALDVLKSRCFDPLLSVKKIAIQSVTAVLTAYPESKEVQVFWMECLLPSIGDCEPSMQEKCVHLCEEVLLKGLMDDGEKETLAWDLLQYLTTQEGDESRVYLKKIIKQWQVQNKLEKELLEKLCRNLKKTDRNVCAWMLMRMFTLYLGDAATASIVIEQWKNQIHTAILEVTKMDVIASVGQVAGYLAKTQLGDVIEKLQSAVLDQRTTHHLISFHFDAVFKLLKSYHKTEAEARAAMDVWCASLLKASDAWLSSVIMNTLSDNFNKFWLVKHLYIVGQASLISVKSVLPRVLLSMKALLTNPAEVVDTIPSSGGCSQPLSQFREHGIPTEIRAHTIMNLGQACFLNEDLAREVVPAMARELVTCKDEAVRNNVLFVFADLCVLHTHLIDPYLPEMATCLADESVIIREHAVLFLSDLIKKEFVKWRGTLLFKYVLACCDPNTKVRNLARYFLLQEHFRGQGVAGAMFYRNFVACILYYNAYNEHNLHQFHKTDREKRLIDLSGPGKAEKRMQIYSFLLENFEDENRMNLTKKLCSDILEGFVESSIPLNNKTCHILTDALSILCCKEIRLKSLKSRAGDDGDEEMTSEQGEHNAMKHKMKHKIISQVVKRNLIENIIPIIIALKNVLIEKKSPLVQKVMLYLKEVMKEYKAEVKEILAADKQLACEIEFDLKMFEREEEEAQRQEEPDLQISVSMRKSVTPCTPTTPAGPSAGRGRSGGPGPSSGQGNVAQTLQGGSVGFVTPATARRRNRPLHIEAVLNSVRKTPMLQPTAARTSRAASTPTSSNAANITFATNDLSIIATMSQDKENSAPKKRKGNSQDVQVHSEEESATPAAREKQSAGPTSSNKKRRSRRTKK